MHSVIFISIRNIESKRNIEQSKFTSHNNLFPNPINKIRDAIRKRKVAWRLITRKSETREKIKTREIEPCGNKQKAPKVFEDLNYRINFFYSFLLIWNSLQDTLIQFRLQTYKSKQP